MQLLLENVAISSAAANDLLDKLENEVALAFNPANFAAAGELAFLQSYRKLRQYIRYVAITDATANGHSCVPGNGNGEVKEIMSILRCASFDGYFSLACNPGANLDCETITDAFYKLLDES